MTEQTLPSASAANAAQANPANAGRASFNPLPLRLLLLAAPFMATVVALALTEAGANVAYHRAFVAQTSAACLICLFAGLLSVFPMAAFLTRGPEAVLKSALLGGIILLTATMALALVVAALLVAVRNETFLVILAAFYLAQLVAESAVWTWIIRRPVL